MTASKPQTRPHSTQASINLWLSLNRLRSCSESFELPWIDAIGSGIGIEHLFDSSREHLFNFH